MSTTAGYVYVMINPSFNGLVKIGKTQNSPEIRAMELSSATGVPTPFYIAYQAYFDDCSEAEIFLHTLLEKNRLADNKEFFNISVREAIKAVMDAENNLGRVQESANKNSIENKELSTKFEMPWKSVFQSANAL